MKVVLMPPAVASQDGIFLLWLTFDTRTDLTDVERAKLRTLLKKMEPARSEEWGKRQFKIVFLTPHDSPDTLVLPDDIANDSTTGSGRGTAFTRAQRYVSLSRLEKGPKTTSELV